MAGFRAGISVGGSGIDAAGFGDGACSRQYRFEKCGLTALERAHQCNTPWTSGTSDVLSHSPPPSILKSAHDRVGSLMLRLSRGFGKRENVAGEFRYLGMQCSGRDPARYPTKVASAARPQFQALEPRGNADADLALHAERLQCDRIIGAADQHVAADADAKRRTALG